MDKERIDAIARMLARTDPRRRALGIVFGGAGAGLLGRAIPAIAVVKADCARAGETCDEDAGCCSGRCQDGACAGQRDGADAAAGSGGRDARERNKGRGNKQSRGDKKRNKDRQQSDATADPEATAAPDPAAGNGTPEPDASGEPDATAEPEATAGADGACLTGGKRCKQDARCCSGSCVDGACAKKGRAAGEATSRAASTVTGSSDRVLVKLYNHRFDPSKAGVDYKRMTYRPRQFTVGHVIEDPTRGNLRVDNAGTYAGWDILTTFNWSVHRAMKSNDWLELQINRDAVAAVVWRGGSGIPSWLKSWTKAGNVTVGGKAFPTYRKTLTAGAQDLGAVYGASDSGSTARDTYWVLLAEKDGLPSPEPRVPSGKSRPTPNDTCPTWVHDQYVQTGPDGKPWPTWHQHIDAVYWCYHRHEHGSDPAFFDKSQKPVYGYVTMRHDYPEDMKEAHTGFKTYVLDDPAGNHWMITQHFGTTGMARACQRFHTVDIAVRRKDGLLLADVHFMADYGKSLVNNTGEAFRPAMCPNQARDAGDSRGARKLPTQASGYTGYEPWKFDERGNVLGVRGNFTTNTPDTVAYCNNVTCDQAVSTKGGNGSEHFLTPNDGFSLTDPKHGGDGTFYTDDLGKKLVSAGTAGAIRQYVRPGIPALSLPPGGGGGHYRDLRAWGRPYIMTQIDSNPTGREGSIQAPN